ncbi:MAG: hypothetical protein SynsKO_10850 [Synoicihabitans sp.]
MLRAVVTAEYVVGTGAGTVLKGLFAGSAVMLAGPVDAQTAATPIELDPGPGGLPVKATVGVPFGGGFAIVGTPATARSYEVLGDIPPGLQILNLMGDTVNATAVSILGTPTEAGEYVLRARAWSGLNKTQEGGGESFDYTIVVADAPEATPSISHQPVSLTVADGAEAVFAVTASGNPAPTFQWRKDGAAIPGATAPTLTLPSASTGSAGNYSVVVTNSQGSAVSDSATLTIAAAAIVISSSPTSIDVVPGGTGTMAVVASATSSLSYQWFRFRTGEGLRILSAQTGPTLTLFNVTAADMGFYFARVTDGTETLSSDYAVLTVQGGTSRLANLSTRGSVPTHGRLTPGFVLRGSEPKRLVIRAVGPTLTGFGVLTAMVDPTMSVLVPNGSVPDAANDNWGDADNVTELVATSGLVGAFPLDDASRDAAVLTTLALPNSVGNGSYTVQITSVDGSAGIINAEVYDPDGVEEGARLSNISARGFSGVGGDALIPGFVIDGGGAKTMLIRVGGPLLASLGLPNTMVDPRLEVVPSGETFVVASNDDWGGTAELKAAFSSTGAFPFDSDASLDAAVLVRLPPGGYTVRVTGADDGVGEVIVEAYEVLE